MAAGRVIWITGLSGAGKTTLAKALLPLLPQPRLLLDGDEMREALGLLAGGYERDDRLRLALTYGRLCLLAAGQGQNVICATISLFHEVHQWNRRNLPGYFEVFLDVPAEAIKRRDYKRVYDQAEARPVMGQTIEPEFPQRPDMVLREEGVAPADAAESIMQKIREGGTASDAH